MAERIVNLTTIPRSGAWPRQTGSGMIGHHFWPRAQPITGSESWSNAGGGGTAGGTTNIGHSTAG